MVKVTLDLDKCVACGMCVQIAPEIFENDMSTLKVKVIGGEREGSNWIAELSDESMRDGAERAAVGCLMKAIVVE